MLAIGRMIAGLRVTDVVDAQAEMALGIETPGAWRIMCCGRQQSHQMRWAMTFERVIQTG